MLIIEEFAIVLLSELLYIKIPYDVGLSEKTFNVLLKNSEFEESEIIIPLAPGESIFRIFPDILFEFDDFSSKRVGPKQ